MTFTAPFPGSAKLDETQNSIIGYQLATTANLLDISAQNAEFDDSSKMAVNLATLEPVDHRPQIQRHLIFVLAADADYAAMAAAKMSQLGGPKKTFNIFVSGNPEEIIIFFRL